MQRRDLLTLTAAGLAALRAEAASPPVRTRVTTELGSFVIEVRPDVAPVTVANYLRHVDERLLDGGAVYRIVTMANQPPQTAHRIEVVQWGRNAADGAPPPYPPIAHETTRDTGLKHRDGTVSMARLGPGTATSEFFVCIGDQPELDFGGRRNPDGQGFAAFGQVVEGRDIVQALHARGRADTQYLQPAIRVLTVRREPPSR